MFNLAGRISAIEILMEIVFAQYWADEPKKKVEQNAQDIERLLTSNPANSDLLEGDDQESILYRETLHSLRERLKAAQGRAAAIRTS